MDSTFGQLYYILMCQNNTRPASAGFQPDMRTLAGYFFPEPAGNR
jgi:hypothetical protein